MAPPTRPRVLVVAYDFPPHAAIGTMRTLRVVRQLSARGWDVAVLTGDERTFLPGTPVDQALLARVPADVRVVRAASWRGWDRLQRAVRGRANGAGSRPGTEPASRGGSKPEAAHGAGSTTRPAASGSQHPQGRETGTASASWRLSPLVRPVVAAKDVVDAALSIPDRELAWLLPAIRLGSGSSFHGWTPDVIYSSAPPWTGQLVAAALAFGHECPWVADFRDPWARAPWRDDKYGFWLKAVAVLERLVVKRADRIVFVAQGNHDDFAAHYGSELARKFHVVPNGCDPTEVDIPDRPAVPTDGPFVLLHAGSLYAGRTPVPLFEAIAAGIARGLIDPSRFRLRFLGAQGLQSVDLPAALRALGIEQMVEFLPRVPRSESLRAMMSASALFLLQPGHTISVPGKVYEYLAIGRPILSIAEEGETAEIVRESGVGVSATPEDREGILRGLLQVMQMAEHPPAPPAQDLYDGNLRAGRIVDILEGMLQRAQHAASAGLEADGDVGAKAGGGISS
ncbi:MAG: glycosyltransferase [Vicinamibacterales bacterium]